MPKYDLTFKTSPAGLAHKLAVCRVSEPMQLQFVGAWKSISACSRSTCKAGFPANATNVRNVRNVRSVRNVRIASSSQ